MASRLDGAGVAKLATLDDALTQLQRVHALVERMASAARSNQDVGPMRQQIHRAASPLVGLLKPQFGMIADQISQMILILTRGGGDQMKVRAMREGVAQVRTQIEVSMAKVREQHTVTDA